MTRETFCNLAADAGPCRAYMPMYSFDTTAQSCKEFIYGGCLGNDNRFESIRQCMEKCGIDDGSKSTGKTKFNDQLENLII
ncbi:hypothetical protein SNEBB_010237 [Seison nebaliae]|nr:hypothetical protein SNEBB_010237 [Seison nebaliae]